jgi:hypothetical protein
MHSVTVFRWCCRLLLMAAVVAAGSRPVSACDYGYIPLPQVFDAATDVFVGTVTDSVFSRGADGQIVVSSRRDGSLSYRFKVLAKYKGAVAAGDEVTLDSTGSDCEYTFLQGATYVVHASSGSEGRLVSGGLASRPILVPPSDGSPAPRDTGDPATYWSPELAIAYADTRLHGRPHAFIHGSVIFNGRYGIPTGARPSDDVTVDAERAGAPTDVVRASNTHGSPFEMVLPPGTYHFRVRLLGVQVGDVVTISVADGELRRINLGPGWPP